jgi:hypothetical protein
MSTVCSRKQGSSCNNVKSVAPISIGVPRSKKPSKNRAAQNTSEILSYHLLYAAEDCEASEIGKPYAARDCKASEIPRCV